MVARWWSSTGTCKWCCPQPILAYRSGGQWETGTGIYVVHSNSKVCICDVCVCVQSQSCSMYVHNMGLCTWTFNYIAFLISILFQLPLPPPPPHCNLHVNTYFGFQRQIGSWHLTNLPWMERVQIFKKLPWDRYMCVTMGSYTIDVYTHVQVVIH